jgi:hypothetical protein
VPRSISSGAPVDKAESLKWYLLAADLGDANAQSALGAMYGMGDGVSALQNLGSKRAVIPTERRTDTDKNIAIGKTAERKHRRKGIAGKSVGFISIVPWCELARV